MNASHRFLTALVGGAILLAACAGTPEAAPAPGAGPQAAAPAQAPAASHDSLALGKSISSNGHIYDFVPQSAVDGEVLSYFEGPANSYPNLLTIDLDHSAQIKSMTLRVNPKRIWQARTQTIEVQISEDGTNFTTAVPSKDYQFDPEENDNSVKIDWAGKARYVRLVCTANTEATGFQVAEWEIEGQ